jgi:hypothetical protein
MSHTKQAETLPDGFECTEDQTSDITLFDNDGTVITVHEREKGRQTDAYPFVVRCSVDQQDKYAGVFQSYLDAQAQAYSLAERYHDD